MSGPVTRPAISDEEVLKAWRSYRDRGGSIQLADPRISQLQTWVLGLVGTGILSFWMWVAYSIVEGDRVQTRILTSIEYLTKSVDKMNDKLEPKNGH